ncbi:MAG TPA: DUF1254 domain-containing protein [Steroidobacter sp.]
MAAGIAGFTSLHSQLADAVALDRRLSLEQAAGEAWLYGLMLIENAQARTKALARGKPNELIHNRKLTTPETQSVTSPNNDTLYSRAWLDLAAGPVTLTMPEVGERYISYAFMDMYGNNFAILGSRTTGGRAGKITIVGPGAASDDPRVVRSPTRWVWLLIRVLIDGDADLRAANAIQDRIGIDAATVTMPAQFARRTDPWPVYFESVQRLMVESPPPVTDRALFARIAELGLSPTQPFNARNFSAADGKRIEAGIAAARKRVTAGRGGRVVDGWVYPNSNLGNFGQDYLYRAQIALSGLAALTPVEAIYMRPVAADGSNVLPSATRWRLYFDKKLLPPVHAFWSLTMYEATPDGQYFFFDNPIDRYAIGDRTPGLRYEADGSLALWISRDDPGEPRRSNWLPAPASEKFGISFRAYLPKPELIEGRYTLPPLEQV